MGSRADGRRSKAVAGRGVVGGAPATLRAVACARSLCPTGGRRSEHGLLRPAAIAPTAGTAPPAATRRSASASASRFEVETAAWAALDSAQTQLKPAWAKSFTALAARTALTTRASRGRVTRRATRPSALQRPHAARAGEELADRVAHAVPARAALAVRALLDERLAHPGVDLLLGDELRERERRDAEGEDLGRADGLVALVAGGDEEGAEGGAPARAQGRVVAPAGGRCVGSVGAGHVVAGYPPHPPVRTTVRRQGVRDSA